MTLARKLLAAAPAAAAGAFEFWDPSSAGGGWTWDHAYDAAGPNMSAAYSDTDAVTGAWLDEVGSFNPARAGGGTLTYQAAGLGGRPAIDFDGTGYFSSDVGAGIAAPHSVVTVVQPDAAAGRISSSGQSSSTRHLQWIDSSGNWALNTSSGGISNGAADTSAHLIVTVVKTGGAGVIRVDGVTETDTTGLVSNDSRPLTIAAGFGGTAALNGRIAAQGVYDGDITAASGFATWEAACLTHYGI